MRSDQVCSAERWFHTHQEVFEVHKPPVVQREPSLLEALRLLRGRQEKSLKVQALPPV